MVVFFAMAEGATLASRATYQKPPSLMLRPVRIGRAMQMPVLKPRGLVAKFVTCAVELDCQATEQTFSNNLGPTFEHQLPSSGK